MVNPTQSTATWRVFGRKYHALDYQYIKNGQVVCGFNVRNVSRMSVYEYREGGPLVPVCKACQQEVLARLK